MAEAQLSHLTVQVVDDDGVVLAIQAEARSAWMLASLLERIGNELGQHLDAMGSEATRART